MHCEHGRGRERELRMSFSVTLETVEWESRAIACESHERQRVWFVLRYEKEKKKEGTGREGVRKYH